MKGEVLSACVCVCVFLCTQLSNVMVILSKVNQVHWALLVMFSLVAWTVALDQELGDY